MSKYVVVVVPDENKAYDARRALSALHEEGSITVYATAVIAKAKDGGMSVKEAIEPGPLGLGVGALTGGLVGILGGPVGMAMGLATGSVVGGIADITNAGVDADFVEAVAQKLKPGKAAVIAEIAEDWITPLDMRMEAIGGDVIRTWRSDFEDEQEEKEIRQRRAEIARLKEEWKQASAERKAKLQARLDEAQAKLDRTAKHVEDRMHQLEEQAKAQIKELQSQAARARAEAKATIEAQIAATRADNERRMGLLKMAAELTREAFAA